MTVDLAAAQAFIDTHARLLDRRRYVLLSGGDDDGDDRDSDPAAVLAALAAYSNPDGGYGWGLEPDLRSRDSQPAAAGHAFEVFAEAGPACGPHAAGLCSWLESITLADGGLPFVVPMSTSAGVAPWFAGGDPTVSSLQITAFVAAAAHHVAANDPAVAGHPWLARATRYCLDAIAALKAEPFAYVLAFSIRLLDALYERRPEATALMEALGTHVPADGRVPVAGGAEGRRCARLISPRIPAGPLERCSIPRRSPPTCGASPAASRTTAAGRWTTSRSPPRGRWTGGATPRSRRSRRSGATTRWCHERIRTLG
jgi:hypothetical protein